MKADKSPSLAKVANTMPNVCSICQDTKSFLWLVLDRLIVKGYSCARKTTVVE